MKEHNQKDCRKRTNEFIITETQRTPENTNNNDKYQKHILLIITLNISDLISPVKIYGLDDWIKKQMHPSVANKKHVFALKTGNILK